MAPLFHPEIFVYFCFLRLSCVRSDINKATHSHQDLLLCSHIGRLGHSAFWRVWELLQCAPIKCFPFISFVGIFKKSTQTDCFWHLHLSMDFTACWVLLGGDDPPKRNTCLSHYYQHRATREINPLFLLGGPYPNTQSGRNRIERMREINAERQWYNRWIYIPPLCFFVCFLYQMQASLTVSAFSLSVQFPSFFFFSSKTLGLMLPRTLYSFHISV